MPYLDWKALTPQQLRQEVGPTASASESAPDHLRMTLSVEASQLATLAAVLRDTLDPESSGELRLELPRGWLVFWKKREGESRLLMAHPQPDAWVATVALGSAPALGLVKSLDHLAASPQANPLNIGSLSAPEGWGSVSNLELVLARL